MYYIKRIIKGIINIFLITSMSFFLVSMIPGDPATSILGINANKKVIDIFNETFELDKPILERYISWIMKAVKGDLGISFKYNTSVKSLIIEKLPITIVITIISLIIILVFSIILSIYLNKKNNKLLEFVLSISIAVPSFWLGQIFIYVFSVVFRVFSSGYNDNISSLIIPCLIISIPKIGQLTFNIKNNIYYETRKDYVKFLYSNGMKIKYLNMYILKNAILPILPIIGLMIIDLLTGVLIIEQVFSIPGIGRLMLSAVYNRDIPLAQGLIIYTSTVVIVINTLMDILHYKLDRRIGVGDNL